MASTNKMTKENSMTADSNESFCIIVHGGAWDIPQNHHSSHLSGVEKSIKVGLNALESGGNAVQAAIAAVRTMEDDPTFDAGFGSFLNKAGAVEMDAIIMDGSDLSFGAVAAIQNVKNPVLVAERIRIKTDHSFLVGSGATQFAIENGIKFCPTENLLVGRELERYKELKKRKNIKTRDFFETTRASDTVGAVTLDRYGNIAVATSTGGTPNKLPGRVGDSPVIGSGAYADNFRGGASSTGWGESLMKVTLAKSALDYIHSGLSTQEACRRVIQYLSSRVDGRGGIICMDRQGRAAYAFNTPFMARAIANQHGIIHIGIKPE
jgi:beta-aspartyl-peptidase (threonine type)